MTGLLPQRVLLTNWGRGAVITGKWKDVQPRGKEKMRGSTKRRNCEFLYFLSSNILNIYYLLLLRIVMNYSCAISGVSLDFQDIYCKVFTILNYYVYILINKKWTKCDYNIWGTKLCTLVALCISLCSSSTGANWDHQLIFCWRVLPYLQQRICFVCIQEEFILVLPMFKYLGFLKVIPSNHLPRSASNLMSPSCGSLLSLTSLLIIG